MASPEPTLPEPVEQRFLFNPEPAATAPAWKNQVCQTRATKVPGRIPSLVGGSWRLLIAHVNVSSFIPEGATLCDTWKIQVSQNCSTLFSRSSRRSLTVSYGAGGSTYFAAP